MSDGGMPHPFGDQDDGKSKLGPRQAAPDWLVGVGILGGAVLALGLAVYLGISLYRNAVADYSGLKPQSTRTEAKTEPDQPGRADEPGGPSSTPDPNGPPGPKTEPGGGDPWTGGGGSRTASSGNLRAEVSGLVGLRFPNSRTLFFKAIYKNTGSAPIGFPKAQVLLLDGRGTVLSTKTGYASMHTLYPGQRAAVTALITDPPSFRAAEVRVQDLRKPYQDHPRLKLQVLNGRITSRTSYSHRVTGEVRNGEEFSVHRIRVGVLLFSKEGKLAGAGIGWVGRAGQKTLASGETASFSLSVAPVNGKPNRLEFTTEGRQSK